VNDSVTDSVNEHDSYYFEQITSPVGGLGILVDDAGRLVRLAFLGRDGDAESTFQTQLAGGDRLVADPGRCAEVARQLGEYFDGERQRFDLELAPRGTDFQRQVWRSLAEIPFGETRSYAEIAERIGRPRAVRAVGRANGANPIPIIVPCHRVVGSDGSLTGFGGGLEAKRRLLDLESREVGLFAVG
jgi:O-6-methylguanine DNA methyltransferase